MLALTGAGAAGMLAGCVGGDDDDDDGNENGGDGQLVRDEFVTTHIGAQDEVQFNPHNVTLPVEWDATTAVYVQHLVTSVTHGEDLPIGLRDWTLDGDRVEVEVQDALTWHDGDQLGADDFVLRLRIGYYQGPSRNYGQNPADFVESPEDIYAEDDTTAVVELDGEYNPVIVMDEIVDGSFDHHEEVYGEYLERFEDATSDEEVEDVATELAEFRLDDPEPHASGPFVFEDMDTQGIYFEPYEDYPWATIQDHLEENFDAIDLSDYPDELNYEGQFNRFFGDRVPLTQAAIQGDVDGGDGLEIDSLDELERQYPDFADYNPIVSGWTDAFVFNWIDGEYADLWRDRRVRKAFAHILDFEAIRDQYHGEFGYVDRYFSGTSPPMRENWLSDEFIEELPTYEQDFERAEELLQDAGLTEEDGQWYTPGGELLEATWAGPTGVQWQVDGMTVAAENLVQFGIESTVEVVETTTYFGQTLPQLDYELARGFIGFSDVVNGWYLTWLRYDGANEDEEPFSYYLEEPYGEPGIEVPPIGEPDSDDTIEVDPVALYDELTQTTDEDRISEISETLSWAFNRTVPKLPGSAGVYGWYMTQRWNYPDDFEGREDPLTGIMPYTYSLPQIGAISAKTQEEFEF